MMIVYNRKDLWENIPDPATLEALEVSKKREKVEKYIVKKFCSTKRESSDGWKQEGKQIYFELVEKVKKLREDPGTGSDFEHKLMVKCVLVI